MSKIDKVYLIVLVLILLINSFLVIYLFKPGITSMAILDSEASLASPSNFIKENQIKADSEKIVIDINNSILSRYNSSQSMIPLLNKNSTGIGIRPDLENQINIGDIISYWSNEKMIVHRVVEKREDNQGVYFITKGDNNFNKDKQKIRFEDIDSVLIGVIY